VPRHKAITTKNPTSSLRPSSRICIEAGILFQSELLSLHICPSSFRGRSRGSCPAIGSPQTQVRFPRIISKHVATSILVQRTRSSCSDNCIQLTVLSQQLISGEVSQPHQITRSLASHARTLSKQVACSTCILFSLCTPKPTVQRTLALSRTCLR